MKYINWLTTYLEKISAIKSGVDPGLIFRGPFLWNIRYFCEKENFVNVFQLCKIFNFKSLQICFIINNILLNNVTLIHNSFIMTLFFWKGCFLCIWISRKDQFYTVKFCEESDFSKCNFVKGQLNSPKFRQDQPL